MPELLADPRDLIHPLALTLSTMNLQPQPSCRNARPDDASECIRLRALTRQNAVSAARLDALGINAQSWSASIRNGSLHGVVCVCGQRIVGYCFGNSRSGEIVVLALLPDFEQLGIGRALLDRVAGALLRQGHRMLFLCCAPDPASRSDGFYRHLGWRSANSFDRNGDERLESPVVHASGA